MDVVSSNLWCLAKEYTGISARLLPTNEHGFRRARLRRIPGLQIPQPLDKHIEIDSLALREYYSGKDILPATYIGRIKVKFIGECLLRLLRTQCLVE